MVKPLTKTARISNEQKRISRLTNPHSQHFKIIFSHQIESGFVFRSLHRGRGGDLSASDKLKIFTAFGRFMDDCVKSTITEVENKYARTPDSSDGTYDPETGEEVEVQHLCLFDSDATPTTPSDSVRIHGYFRPQGGYFVITRLDWFHGIH